MSIETMIKFQQSIKAGKLSDVIDMYNSLNLNSEPVNTYILNYACEVNKLNIIKWILNNVKFDSNTLSNVFLNTIPYGHIHISQWLHENYGSQINIHIYNNLAFKLATYHKRQDYINWLYNNEDIQTLFLDTCKSGNLQMVTQIYNTRKSDLNIRENDDWIFRITCYNNQLHIAEWLLTIEPEIKVSVVDEYIFRYSCAKGNLDVIKWLYTKNPYMNISTYSHFGFKHACINNHIHIVEWLCSLNVNYRVECAKNKITKWFIDDVEYINRFL